MYSNRQLLLAGLPFVLAAFLAAPVVAETFTLRVVDAESGLPTAVRVQLLDADGPLFGEENTQLRAHIDPAGHPYFYVEDFVELELPAGEYTVRCYRGPASIPQEIPVSLQANQELLVSMEDWINPRDWGWYCADPHVHLQHADDPDGEPDYLASSPADAGRAGRAEGLDALYLLENLASTPRGLVEPAEPGVSVCWGEEFRSAYWGHMVVLNAASLITVEGNPWANGPGLPAWPMLRKLLQDNAPPLAYMAHPTTGATDPFAQSWPSVGVARELQSLLDVPELQGIAVGSGSNGPVGAWNIEPLREGLGGGASWKAFGETDAVLGRLHMRPLGSPRTYARLTRSPSAGSAALESQWRKAAVAGRSYASDGPLLLEFGLGGAEMGETASPMDELAALSMHLVSWTPLRRVTLWGSSGRGVDIPIDPSSIHEMQIQLDVQFETDELVFVEAVAEGGTWYAMEDSLRLVSSPVRILRGVPTTVPGEWARRNADGLRQLWRDSLQFRGYASAADSAAARGILEDAEAVWEGLSDDPPGAFGLVWPPDGRSVGSQALQLSWNTARSYDGEEIRYEVYLDTAPDFAQAELFTDLADTMLFLRDLEDDTEFWWKVRAYEPDGDLTWMREGAVSFTAAPDAVDAPSPQTTLLQLSAPHATAGGVRAFLELSRATHVKWSWYDARGRVLFASGRQALSAGRHELRWNGTDRQGRSVASGVYWLVADAEGRRSVRSTVLLEP